jgi:hypothetical protein
METNKNRGNELDHAPRLNALPKKEPLQAPEGYFESFPSQIMARIQAETPAPSRTQKRAFWYLGASAAAVAAVFLVFFWSAEPTVVPEGPFVEGIAPEFEKLTNEELAQAADMENVAIEEVYVVAETPAEEVKEADKKMEIELKKIPAAELEEILDEVSEADLESLL